MLQRSVTLMRRLSWTRPQESTSGWAAMLLEREHAFERHQGAFDDLARQLDPRFEVLEAIPQLLERVQLHVRALAAIAVLIGHVVEALVRRHPLQRIVDAAFGHHD